MEDKLINKSLLVPVNYLGQRADVVLAKLFPQYSRSQLTNWLKEGLITFGQRRYKPKDKVLGGECVTIPFALHSQRVEKTNYYPQKIPLEIIYEDKELLIVNKQDNLIVHPGAGNPDRTLVNALLYHDSELKNLPRAGIIHRLDKNTTGLLIIAKTLSAHTFLIRQMQARQIQRHYLALVQGPIIAGGKIETNYGRHHTNRLKMAVCTQGKIATTLYCIRKRYPDFTLLDVQLLTGRTHQIRVHMAYIKHPIVGDSLYGGRMRFPRRANENLRTALQQFQRQALHAYKLSFPHPENQKLLTFEAPVPEDFKRLITLLDSRNE